jgi:hypothetical protein
MSKYASVFFRRYLRLAVVVCLGWSALVAGGACFAATRAELYQATAPVADRSEAAQSAAFQAALRMVLVRATGRRTADEDPALAPLVSNARRYVQQYRTAADGQLWVAFDGPALERWLTQNGQPLWGHERPSTFVWLAVQSGPQTGSVITADDTSELKTAIDTAAVARGIQLLWPSTADLQKDHLDYAGVTSGSTATLVEFAHRLGGDGTLIGRASNASAAANVHWTHQFEDHSGDFSGALEGVNRAADTYAGMFAASGSLVPIDIEVAGVADLRQYASVQSYLESLSFISHVAVQALRGDTVQFRLTTRGGTDVLLRALAQDGRMQPTAVGENGIQRFQLRR